MKLCHEWCEIGASSCQLQIILHDLTFYHLSTSCQIVFLVRVIQSTTGITCRCSLDFQVFRLPDSMVFMLGPPDHCKCHAHLSKVYIEKLSFLFFSIIIQSGFRQKYIYGGAFVQGLLTLFIRSAPALSGLWGGAFSS